MKLRQKSKRDQALDAVASIAKTWSEWRLGERVSHSAAKGAKKASRSARRGARKASKSASGGGGRKPVKVAGAIAIVGGIGAAVAKKLRGGKAEPLYTPPVPAAETATPPVAPVTPGLGDVPQSPTTNVPIAPPAEPPPATPIEAPPAGSGAAAPAGAPPAADREEAGPEEPGTASPSSGASPDPEDLAGSASEPEGDGDAAAVDEATERP